MIQSQSLRILQNLLCVKKTVKNNLRTELYKKFYVINNI